MLKFSRLLILMCLLVKILQGSDLPELKYEEIGNDSGLSVFKFADFNSLYLKQLRMQFELDKVVLDCITEYDKTLAMMNWVNHLWRHNGDNKPIKNDPISILTEVINHQKQFRCVEYSVVLNGCLNAIGIHSRVLALKTIDVETRESGAGHVVTEAYLPSLGKWILLDAQFNLQPILNGVPLNALELQRALVAKDSALDFASFDPDQTKYTKEEVAGYKSDFINFIGQYLYYFDTKIDGSNLKYSGANAEYRRLMLVPLGAKKPTVFQIKHPLDNIEYTHSVACFYQIK